MGFTQTKEKKYHKLGFLYLPLVGGILLFLSEIVIFAYSELMVYLLSASGDILNLIELSGFLFITLITLLWARKAEKISWKELGFVKKSGLKQFLLGWAAGGVVLTVCVLLMLLLGGVRITDVEISPGMVLQLLPLLVVWSIQGNAEEVLTRGWLFASVARKNGILPGILVSAVFFTALHLANDGISFLPLLDLLLFGVFAALYRMKTGNIWGISGFHAAWNCFQGNIFAFPVSGSSMGQAFIKVTPVGHSWISGGSFGVEGSLVSVVVQSVLILWLIYSLFFKGKREKESNPNEEAKNDSGAENENNSNARIDKSGALPYDIENGKGVEREE